MSPERGRPIVVRQQTVDLLDCLRKNGCGHLQVLVRERFRGQEGSDDAARHHGGKSKHRTRPPESLTARFRKGEKPQQPVEAHPARRSM